METILEKIKNVVSVTNKASCDLNQDVSYEDKVNKVLDTILKWQKKISTVTDSFSALNADLLADFNTIGFTDDLYKELVKLKISAAKLISSLKKSEFYPGTKTFVKELKLEYDNLVEIIEDFELSHKRILFDRDFLDLINQLD